MKNHLGILITLTASGLILLLTLWPTPQLSAREVGFLCLLCGPRDLADAILNLFLFLPLGAGLSLIHGPWFALGGSLAVSGVVELCQTAIPGRFSTVGDLLFNTLGGVAGALLLHHRHRILGAIGRPSRRTATLGIVFPFMAFLTTALLSTPSYPDTIYYGQWTRDLGSLQAYPGEVLSAFVGGVPLPDRRVHNQGPLMEALRSGGGEISLRMVVAARPPFELTHVLAIYDHRRREILLVGVQGTDLVWRRRTFSESLRLDRPELKWAGALEAEPGDTLSITLRPTGRDLCADVNGRTRCGLAHGAEAGWRFLHRAPGSHRLPTWVLGALWLLTVTLPAGVTSRGYDMARGVSILLGFILVSWTSPSLSLHFAYLPFPILGYLAGLGAARLIRGTPSGIAVSTPAE